MRTVGALDRPVTRPAPLDAGVPGAVTFCRATGDEGRSAIAATGAGTVVCADMDAVDEFADRKTFIVVDEPRLAFLRVVERLFRLPAPSGIHPTAVVDEAAKLGTDVAIGAFSFVGAADPGAGTVVHPHVTINSGTTAAANVLVGSATV